MTALTIAREGWGTFTDVEDMALAFDDRLNWLDLRQLVNHLEMPVRYVYGKPRFWNSQSLGFESMEAADVASLLIFLEQLGFEVDPGALVDALYQTLSNKSRLTGPELDILRYPKLHQRHRYELHSDVQRFDRLARLDQKRMRTTTGCRLEMTLIGDRPLKLEFKGPKFKKRPEPKSHKCSYCGMTYMKGDREENASHLSYHAKIRRLLDPTPQARFIQALDNDEQPELVVASSPVWKHREVYQRACQFRREMRFDRVQWGCDHRGKDDDKKVHGFLFGDDSGTFPRGTIVGACAFRWREDHWGLQWIWIAPKVRRKGILARRWDTFLERFGDFEVEGPLSRAMQELVRRHGTPEQLRIVAGWLSPETAEEAPPN